MPEEVGNACTQGIVDVTNSLDGPPRYIGVAGQEEGRALSGSSCLRGADGDATGDNAGVGDA